jgi:hypothetical protein
MRHYEARLNNLEKEIEQLNYESIQKYTNCNWTIQRVNSLTLDYLNELKVLAREVKMSNFRIGKLENCSEQMSNILLHS